MQQPNRNTICFRIIKACVLCFKTFENVMFRKVKLYNIHALYPENADESCQSIKDIVHFYFGSLT